MTTKNSRSNRKRASTAKQWRQKTEIVPLDVPSGNVALVRPVGMQVFLEAGTIPNSLEKMIRDAIASSDGKVVLPNPVDWKQEQVDDILNLLDAVTCYCVVQPQVSPVPFWAEEDHIEERCSKEQVGDIIPIGDPNRDENLLYVDEVDLDDKFMILQFAVGGTRSLEKFREQQSEVMATLLGLQNVEFSAKPTS